MYEGHCDCGWKVRKSQLTLVKVALKKHKHKTRIVKWVKVGVGAFNGTYIS